MIYRVWVAFRLVINHLNGDELHVKWLKLLQDLPSALAIIRSEYHAAKGSRERT